MKMIESTKKGWFSPAFHWMLESDIVSARHH